MITIIAIEALILAIDHWLHLSKWLTVISIEQLSAKSYLKALLAAIVAALTVFLTTASYWTTTTFGLLNPEQIIYNLKQPMEGADQSFMLSFLNGPLLKTLMTFITLFLIALVLFNVEFQGLPKPKVIRWSVAALITIGSIISLTFAAININIGGFYKYFTASSTFIEENYVDPEKTKLTFPKKKRNLIYIYVESLESSSIDKLDGGQMSTNLLPGLTQLSNEGIHFSDTSKKFGGAHQFNGTGWTIAGMVAQTSGLPLKVPVQGNDYANSAKQQFLPGATTLNDILAKEGYQQTILMGSDATFGGRRSYFTQHGHVTIDDYLQAKKDKRIPEDYRVWWGYEDSKLFTYAQQDLSKLAASDKPFNFTMLTANTHHIGGYPEANMPQKYSDQYSNVIAFTDTQLVEFVTWLKQQSFYDNTTVIIHGDHLSMDADYYKKHGVKDSKRRTFNLILNAPVDQKKVKTRNRMYGTYDMFPTTLAAMGVKIDGNRLGIGTNLLSNKKTVAEKDGFNDVNDELAQSSKFYNDQFMYAKRTK
ncbi:LTA synthase family protein [Lapidilactobacillus wuchangensis]|uniref:LTA synthase family protein n=1 Tax=Lapidilactobacillus wuchangensis TaxID=2486001 RepID=UPI0013DE3F80|nr:LTA synthase family protein [Lapidilactobacillus wuchangensis]